MTTLKPDQANQRLTARHIRGMGMIAVVALMGATAFWTGTRWWSVSRQKAAMARVEQAMKSGRHSLAARELTELVASGRDPDRAGYLLGVCEKARGRIPEALAAWAAIPPGSPFGVRAAASRMDLLVERGRLADAESMIRQAAGAPGAEPSVFEILLVEIFVQEGRADEARRLIEARWQALYDKGDGASEQAINLARLHMELDWVKSDDQLLRAHLEKLRVLNQTDDRVWLGLANLCLSTGALDEARGWIDACSRSRPADPPVWRARLEWAMKANQPEMVRSACKHLPGSQATPAEILRVAAWLAKSCGDIEGERSALALWIAVAPENHTARERLRTLEASRGATPVDASGGIPRDEIERDQARYRELYRRNQPLRDAEEMARLAEKLGRRFEATVFEAAARAETQKTANSPRGMWAKMGGVESSQPATPGETVFDRLPPDCASDDPSR